MPTKHLLLAGVLVLLWGCPGPSDATPRGKCTRLHAQCALSEGLLGVCNEAPCPEDQQPPCFKCVSQH